MKKFVSLSLILAIAVICLVSWRSEAAPQKGKAPDAKGVYQAQCAKCHAADGKGIASLPDIPNFTDAKWQGTRNDKQLTDSINNGIGIMPGFKGAIKPAEVSILVRHVRSFAKK
jgi:mono/diheme cytochrome c family protein